TNGASPHLRLSAKFIRVQTLSRNVSRTLSQSHWSYDAEFRTSKILKRNSTAELNFTGANSACARKIKFIPISKF
ncbi:hypothetical protein, partial [uncultured Campylobacter sp.]|uniref:hypothetical protein n=1 Tax=uncultured Campylobacter sp. TaxID=218934 RepID=UPI002630CCC9